MPLVSTFGNLSARAFGLGAYRSSVFSPTSLFSAGEQGVWYDPSDLTTMFEDSAGTTAVHTPGNGTADSPVGKILDKSGRGNHATQSTSTARPTLSARYNLLTYSEQFDNGFWAKNNCTITANQTTAPDGTTTADLFTSNGTNGYHLLYTTTNISITAGLNYTAVLHLKAGTQRYVQFWFGVGNTQSNFGVVIDTTTMGIVTTGNGTFGTYVSSSSTNLGSGWYRYSITGSVTGQTAASPVLGTLENTTYSTLPTSLGNGTIYVWGADMRLTNDGVGLPVYQRIADANTYDSVGFPYYIKSDGVDDSEATSAINFTGTNKITVFAGVRKLSDSAQAVVAELSSTIASNNGTFLLSAPNSAAANYNFSSKGTTQVNNTVTTYTAPISNIITGIGDIGAPNDQIRVNGSVAGTQTGTQGTGNYGNFALYLFRRNSATLPFNGRTYGLIIRGASSTSTEISNTETWLNGKAKAY